MRNNIIIIYYREDMDWITVRLEDEQRKESK